MRPMESVALRQNILALARLNITALAEANNVMLIDHPELTADQLKAAVFKAGKTIERCQFMEAWFNDILAVQKVELGVK